MSEYQPYITENAYNDFYAVIIRVYSNGQAQVIHGYKGRSSTTLAAAEKSTKAYIDKMVANHA